MYTYSYIYIIYIYMYIYIYIYIYSYLNLNVNRSIDIDKKQIHMYIDINISIYICIYTYMCNLRYCRCTPVTNLEMSMANDLEMLIAWGILPCVSWNASQLQIYIDIESWSQCHIWNCNIYIYIYIARPVCPSYRRPLSVGPSLRPPRRRHPSSVTRPRDASATSHRTNVTRRNYFSTIFKSFS